MHTFFSPYYRPLVYYAAQVTARVAELCLRAPQYVLHELYSAFVYAPLRRLYFQGPSLNGFGFWGGLPAPDCCTLALPGTSAVFWADHLHQCEVILDQRFIAFLTVVQFLVYVIYVHRIVSLLAYRYFILGPALRRLECIAAPVHTSVALSKVVTQGVL
jgi:hypothetical protein